MSKIFKLMAWFWITSPLSYIAMRLSGIFNFRADWAAFAVLGLISFGVIAFIMKYGQDSD